MKQSLHELTADTASSKISQQPETHKLVGIRLDLMPPTRADHGFSIERTKQESTIRTTGRVAGARRYMIQSCRLPGATGRAQ